MKKIEKVYFIEAKSPSAHIFAFMESFRLGSPLLATILRDLGFQTKIFVEDIEEIYDEENDEIIAKELLDADIICISSITSTIMRTYKIAEKFRERNIPVVIGGSHVTFFPEEGLLHADYVVRGEGEETIVELIEYLDHNPSKILRNIPGLSFKNSFGVAVHNTERMLIRNLDAYPIPDFDLIANWKHKKVIPIATSRGCPFNCKFCSVVPMFGRKMRFKSIERVMEELRAAMKYNPRHIFFVDDNFTANPRRAEAICQAMIDSRLDIGWSAQVRTEIFRRPVLIEKMAEAGCYNVFIGFESINQKTLEANNKRQKAAESERCIALVHGAGIGVHGMFVFDPDNDNAQVMQDTVEYVKEHKLESVQFLIKTPLPGTLLYEEVEGRLLHTDWSKYDAHHVVYQPTSKNISIEELQMLPLKGMRSFYGWGYSLRWLFEACSFKKENILKGFFYAWIGIYGRRTTRKAIKKAPKYLEMLRERVKILVEKEKCTSGC